MEIFEIIMKNQNEWRDLYSYYDVIALFFALSEKGLKMSYNIYTKLPSKS